MTADLRAVIEAAVPHTWACHENTDRARGCLCDGEFRERTVDKVHAAVSAWAADLENEAGAAAVFRSVLQECVRESYDLNLKRTAAEVLAGWPLPDGVR